MFYDNRGMFNPPDVDEDYIWETELTQYCRDIGFPLKATLHDFLADRFREYDRRLTLLEASLKHIRGGE